MKEEPYPTFIFEVQRSIRLLLQQSNTSQSDLAKALGVSAARVSQLLADDGNITLATVERIAKALNKKPRIVFSDIHAEPVVKCLSCNGEGGFYFNDNNPVWVVCACQDKKEQEKT